MADTAAIVVAGGSSQRIGFDKLRADLAGQSVFLHSLETLHESAEIGQIILVASARNLHDFRAATRHLSKLTHVLPGGVERQHSVAIGLAKVADDFSLVAVHDAARPLLSAGDLQRVLDAAHEHGAASLANPVADTLKRTDVDDFVDFHPSGAVDRVHLWAIQTPQVFRVERLREACEQLLQSGELVTDEVSAVAKLGDRVKLIPAQDFNFKITFSCDIALARTALLSRLENKN